MTFAKHIRESRTVTTICEAINGIGVLLGGIVAVGLFFQADPYSIPAGCVVIAATFVWWFLNKLAYVGLQLLTDITELLANERN